MIQTRTLPVTEPGWYAMSAAEYHADPCPAPSLSASIAKKLLRQTPRHAAFAHPRIHGTGANDPTPAMLFGSVVHTMVLGAGARVKVIEYDNYLTKDAKAARDKALAEGRLPILMKDFDRADRVSEAVRERVQRVVPRMFKGQPELVAIWREGDLWCRAMMDGVDVEGQQVRIDDLKTSAQDISPQGVGKTIGNMGYELQAAFYRRAVRALMPDHREPSFLFAFAEVEPPFEASLVTLTGEALEIGRRQVCAAIELFRRCLAAGEWPGFPAEVIRADLPPWHVGAWEARETEDKALEGVVY